MIGPITTSRELKLLPPSFSQDMRSKTEKISAILKKELINRDDIDKINRLYQEIEVHDLREATNASPISSTVLRSIIEKVDSLIKNESDTSVESLISLFYLSHFNDFPRITKVFNKLLSSIITTPDKKNKLVTRVSIIMPECKSLESFKSDARKLLKIIDPSLNDSFIFNLVFEKIVSINQRIDMKKLRKTKRAQLHNFQYSSKDLLIPILTDDSSTHFSDWHSFADSEDKISTDDSYLGRLVYQIESNFELMDYIKKAKDLRKEQNSNILAVLGTTQVGKSSTLNFLSGQAPYIERGFIHSRLFETKEELSGFTLSDKDGEAIFDYLLEEKLITIDKDESSSDAEESSSNAEESSSFYVPSFSIGERILANGDNPEKTKLNAFIDDRFPHKKKSLLFKFITNQLACAIRKKERSDAARPGIGFRDPIFSYGAGVSTTIIAQAQRQEWNITTIDLPGSGEIRGDEYSLVSAYSTYTSLANTFTVKGAAVLLSYDQLTGDASNAQALIEVLRSANNMLGQTIGPGNICILVTKVPLTKPTRNRRNERIMTNEEIQKRIKDELNKFHALLKNNTSSELSKLEVLLSDLIRENRFAPVIPLKAMDNDYKESVLEDNVNRENRDNIIDLLSKLDPIEVGEGYFSRTYSNQNGNIAQCVNIIRNEIFALSTLLRTYKKQVKKLASELEQKHTAISLDIAVAKKYMQQTQKVIKFEQASFEAAYEFYLEEEQIGLIATTPGRETALSIGAIAAIPRGATALSIDAVTAISEGGAMPILASHPTLIGRTVSQQVDNIKKLALIRAKQQTMETREALEIVDDNNSNQEKTQLEIRKNEIEAIIDQKKVDIAKKEREKKQSQGKKEIVSRIPVKRKEYWYNGSSKEKLTVDHRNYPMKVDYVINKNDGDFRVQKTRIEETAQFGAEFTFDAHKFTFGHYVLECELMIICNSTDRLDYEIRLLQAEIDSLYDDLIVQRAKIEKLESLEKDNRKLNSINKELDVHLQRESNEYLRLLADQQRDIGIEGDRSQIMSLSDIKKVMIGTIAGNCEQAIKEADKIIKESGDFFCNPKYIQLL